MGWWKRLRGSFRGGGRASGGEGPPDSEPVRGADWTDVEMVATMLERHGVEYVLVGGYALHANGLVRATTDVDILVRATPENNRRWIAALSRLPDGVAAGLAGEDDPFPTDPDLDGEPGVIRIFDAFIVDVMPRACGLSYEDLAPHIAILDRGDGSEIKVLDLDGLLKTKQGLRAKDVADREQIEMALARRSPAALRDHREEKA